MSMRNLLRRLDRFRRDHTQSMATWIYRQLGRSRYLEKDRLPASQVRKILVVRNNKRIGNMYFMLPFVRELRQCYPDAQIDLMLIDDSQSGIFRYLGLNNIIVSNFAFISGWSFLRTVLETRRTVYDLLLMPHSSASDTITCAFLHARNKVAFWGQETVGVFPHSFKVAPQSPHAALTALTLLRELGHPARDAGHTLVFSEEELIQGQQTVASLKGTAGLCFAYFRGARGAKIIDDRVWRDIRTRFDVAAPSDVRWVEILSPDIRTPLLPATATFESADLRRLGCMLRHVDLFICADTGPLHLADAAQASCVGLYNVTEPKHYGCLNNHSVNVTDIENLDASAILARVLPSTPFSRTRLQ